ECVAGPHLSLRLDRKHFACVIENGSRSLDFRPRPFAIAKRAERRRFFPRADVAGNEIRLLERNIQLGFIGELDCQDFLFSVCSGSRAGCIPWQSRRHACRYNVRRSLETNEPAKSSDPVLKVHDQIAFSEFAEIDLGAMTFRSTQP